MPVTVPSYTKAGLPSPGTPGDLARVSDSVRGLWMDTGAAWASIAAESVNVREFGTGNDGAAIQAAIDALPPGGGRVIVPAGTYTLTSELLINSNRVWLVGSGRNTILQAGANNITLIHWAGSDGGAIGFNLDTNGSTGVSGLRITPEDELQEETLVFQNFNTFRDLLITSCEEGVVMQAGPRVEGGAESGCWYNVLAEMHILSCRRGIWLKEGPSPAQSGVNRNQFYSIRIGHVCTNTGLQIDSGGTNSFFGCSFEGIQPPLPTCQPPIPPGQPLVPNEHPTAIVIKAAGNSFDNNHNAFFGTSWEACWRDLDCDNSATQFIGTYGLGVGHTTVAPKIVGSDRPAVIITDSPSHSGFSLPALTFSAGILPGYIQTGWNFDVDVILRGTNQIYDHIPATPSGKWQAYALTTTNCSNTATIAESQSKRQQVCGMVDWHFRLRFNALAANNSVDIQLPLEPDIDLYRQYAYIPPMEFVVVTIDYTGAKFVVSAPLTDHAAGTPTRLKIPAPAIGWHTGGDNNTIYGMVRYKAGGY